jgi:molecular chaperone DnaK (HSP70)
MDDIDTYFTDPEITQTIVEQKDEVIIGIDLGTTNSCVAIWRKNNLEIIPDTYGNRTIPSVVAFTSKTKYVGKEAKKQIELNPENTFYEVKRLIGRKYDDESVTNYKEYLSYTIVPDENNNVIIQSKLTSNKQFSPEEISSSILMEAKSMAECYLNQPIYKAVVTVPAYFGDSQRQATKDACHIAGLECVRIINEPTAAALAYGFDKRDGDVNIIIYDLGGGTLDISLLNVSNGIFQVLGVAGNSCLGGADFDSVLMTYCIEQFKLKYKLDELDFINPLAYQKLKQACENSKKRLSEVKKTSIIIPSFYDDKDLFITITKEIFESICKELFILCLKPLSDVLKSCNMDKDMIDEIILVGGCTRMPQIRDNIKLFFNGKEPNISVNPDEVVAAGAAIQGYILSHKADPFSENITLLDVVPLSLGVEIIGGIMNTLIPRNSVIPITKKRKYTNDTDNETFICIKIFEGERKMTKDNYLVGEFELTGITPVLRGINQFEITFTIDVNGIINVTALDLSNTDNKRTITINSNKGRLSPEKIKTLVEESKIYEIKDKTEREKRTLYYNIEDACITIKANVENADFKIKNTDKEGILLYVNNILDKLKMESHTNIDKKEYNKLLNNIKTEYGMLTIKVTNELDDVKTTCSESNATSISNNDDEENVITKELYEELENNELGIRNSENDEIKKEIRRLRDMLVSLCYSVLDILSGLSKDENNVTELREYIDDTLLWTHVKERISVEDYKQKIDEVNTICNNIVDKNEEIFSNRQLSKLEELEQLCFMILSEITSNMFGDNNNNRVEYLKKYIEEILNFICENNSLDSNDEIYDNKINDLNKICDDIYDNIDRSINYSMDNNNNFDDNDEGTTIASLLRKK